MKDETYFFHQTPPNLAKELLKHIPFEDNDVVLEPFKGEGAFFNNFPDNVIKEFCEIEEGLDYKNFDKPFDWVISNPPFRLESGSKRVNSFFYLLDYYSNKAKKGIAFLGNDFCFSTLTPNRIKEINQKGWYLQKIIVCSIKKWRGRYFFIIFSKNPSNLFTCIDGNF